MLNAVKIQLQNCKKAKPSNISNVSRLQVYIMTVLSLKLLRTSCKQQFHEFLASKLLIYMQIKLNKIISL